MSYQAEWRKNYEELWEYSEFLESRIKRLSEELANIAQGYVPGKWEGSTQHGMQKLAGNALAREITTPIPSKPWRRSL